MTETITWLHISDTHFCRERHNWHCEEIFDKFFVDLISMEKQHGLSPDLIFFTGDIAFGQDNSKSLFLKDQYIEAQEFIEKVSNSFSRSIPKTNIFIVPGNHDVNRTQITPDQTYWIKNLQKRGNDNPSEIINELIKSNDNKQWNRFMERLGDYRLFLEERGYNHLLDNPKNLIYSKICRINGYKVGISGLNSAWSSSSDGEKGNLWLGTYQILSSYSFIKEAMFSVSLIHHPPNWFTEFEELDIRKNMERRFKFCLHGHEHNEWITSIDEHIKISSGALYSGYGKKNVYSFVRLYPEEDRGEVFLRKYDNGHWIPHIIGGKTDNNGICNLKNLNLGINKKEYNIGKGASLESIETKADDDVDKELITILENSSVLFIGDKVSEKSGIKSFGFFIIKIIESVTRYEFRPDELSELRRNLHSESVFKILYDILGDKVLIYFEQFNKYNPNPIHYFIANEIKNGKWVFTTNRDNLIEKAYESDGTDCEIIYSGSSFIKFLKDVTNIQNNSRGYLFKLNGTVDEDIDGIKKFETILDSLSQADNELNKYKMKVLKTFMNNFNFCFLGFDCLDNFSLVPTLKNIYTNKSVFWLNYAEKPEIISTKEALETEIKNELSKESKNIRTFCVNNILLNKKNSLKVSCRWTETIQNILFLTQHTNQHAYLTLSEIQEPEEMINLCENLDNYKINIIFGLLWEECLSRDRSISYFEKAAKISEGINRAKAKQNLARVYDMLYGKSKAKTVIKEYESSIKLFVDNEIICEAIQCKLGLANYRRRALDQFNEALNDCREIEKIIKSNEFKQLLESQKKCEEYNRIQAQYYNCLGLIYSRLGCNYLGECENLLEISLNYRKKAKDRKGQAESENSIGLVKRNIHNKNNEELKEAIRHVGRALALNESIGNYIGAARNNRNLGLCYTDLIRLSTNEKDRNDNFQKAKKSYENGINYWHMMKETPPDEEIFEYKYRLGELEINYGNNNEGIKLLLEVEIGWKSIGDWHNRARALHLLCKGYSNDEYILSNGTQCAKQTVDIICDIYNTVITSKEKINQIKNNVKIYENAVQILNETKKMREDIGIKDRDIIESDEKVAILDEILKSLKEIME